MIHKSVSVPLLMVKSSVTIESHPETAPPTRVNVAELLLAVYVFPSIQVYDSQATCVSVQEIELLMVKSSVTIESHPETFHRIEYGRVITGSICISINPCMIHYLCPLLMEMVTIESHPLTLALGMVNVALAL